ncbi:MAG: MFS transporter [Actinomycetota bacterium]|nr:MFS transporter [Actinomycetota bacterium]MEC9467736.1 MFS transporter [Actinomycetota bacterium]MED6327839.1 MFS transporter [Actinomycetota bacterium]
MNALSAGRSSTASSLLGVWALFLAFAFLQIGNGLQRILLPVRGEAEGISAGAMGVVMAVHFAGYLLGAKLIPVALTSVGHIRVFAALASVSSTAVLVNAVLVTTTSWSIVYFVSGLCNAGVFVIIESWLNDRATNETRGSILGAYMMIMMGGTAGGQMLLNLGSSDGFELFVLSSVLISLAVVPVTLSASTAPPVLSGEKMPLGELYRTIPSAVVGIVLCSYVQSAASSMAAVFGTQSGMSAARITLFTSAAVVGAVILQMPLGSLSDRYPRRAVILGVTATSCGLAVVGAVTPATSIWLIALNMAFGAFVFPLYGQFVALANDWVPPNKRVAAASTLVLASSFGAMAAPMSIGIAVESFGPTAYFWSLASCLGILALYLSYRTRVRQAIPVERQSTFQPVFARSGELAHTVGRWVRHPLSEWQHHRDDHDCEVDERHPSLRTRPTDGVD